MALASFIKRAKRRYARDRSGLAVLEFVFIFPSMMLLLVGSIEVVAFTWATGRVEDAAGAVGDLTAQNVTMNEQTMDSLAKAGDTMIRANAETAATIENVQVTVTSALACPCADGNDEFCFEVLWSHRFSSGTPVTGHVQGMPMTNVPSELALNPNDTLIVTEVEYEYDPKIQLLVPDSLLKIEEVSYFRPRLTDRIIHTGQQSFEDEPYCVTDDDDDDD